MFNFMPRPFDMFKFIMVILFKLTVILLKVTGTLIMALIDLIRAQIGKVPMNGGTMTDGDIITVRHFHEQPSTFYCLVRTEIEAQQLPGVKFSMVDMPVGGIGSSNRTYLRIMRDRVYFDIGAQMLGTNLVTSYRIYNTEKGFGLMTTSPVVAQMLRAAIKPETNYTEDSAVSFQYVVVSAYLDVLDRLIEQYEGRAMSPEQRNAIVLQLEQALKK